MRVAFVWFNTASPVGISHGVLILASELSARGHQVRVLHLNEQVGLSLESALSGLKDFSPDLLALSFGSPHADPARQLASAARAGLPGTTILCGGIHTTLSPEEVFGWPGVDAIGIGELDGGPLVDFVGRLATGADHRSVLGFWVRDRDGEHRNKLAPLPRIEDQALPRLDAVNLKMLVESKRGFGEVIAGRGCPFRCRFCQNHALVERYRSSLGGTPASWPYCRMRSVSNLLAELAEMRRLVPEMKAVMFADDRLAGDRRWLAEFARRYPGEIGLPFIVNATADQIDAETAALLDRAGCNMVKIGVECAPGRIRREVLGRPHGEKTIRQAFASCRATGINTMAYIMIGIPGETSREVLSTYRFCADLRPDAVRLSMFCPFPGTSLHAELARQGRIEDTRTVYGFLKPSVLKWPEEMHLLLEKVLVIHPWMLNRNLDGPAGAQSAGLVEWVLSASRETWGDDAFSGELDARSRSLFAELGRSGSPHYSAPFGERPDWAFFKTGRRRPLINVDQP
jgi:anaerobic magnesium-protoporphyrin IX monomethyl ester cyclase